MQSLFLYTGARDLEKSGLVDILFTNLKNDKEKKDQVDPL